MPITSMRLQNFKGFKEAYLPLKPLTVLIGPNSAGKSSFGQALVALSKAHEKRRSLSLELGYDTSIDLGLYEDLVHGGCYGKPIVIGIGTENYEVKYGFGGGAASAETTGILPLDLTSLEIIDKHNYISQVPESSAMNIFNRLTPSEWTGNDNVNYTMLFEGLDIRHFEPITVSSENSTANIIDLNVNGEKTKESVATKDVASLMEFVSYLRPDRIAPSRIYEPPSGIRKGIVVGDRGENTSWFIHRFGTSIDVKTFFFPEPTTDVEKAKQILSELKHVEPKIVKLKSALSEWMKCLGVSHSLETKWVDDNAPEAGIRLEVSVKEGNIPRSLTDLGFGISQVLPILLRGLILNENGILVVEQPEAQLHPKPQAELADFFCSMVKCGKRVLVETHSEALFHRLRLRAEMDEDLNEKIGIFFLDEFDGEKCQDPRQISIKEGAELKWPDGFLPSGFVKEMEIRAFRRAK